jgi:N-carbamoyl-L-amino-acid hydrolase
MNCRRDLASAAAEIVLFAEGAASQRESSVATVGILSVPHGSINTVPGTCELSLDIRAPKDDDRDALAEAIFTEIENICKRRQIRVEHSEVLRVAAAPCDAQLRDCWIDSLNDLGLPVISLPSGAGHDTMKIHQMLPQAMLFVRGENNGISHNPAESTNSYDLQLAFETFERFCLRLAGQGISDE